MKKTLFALAAALLMTLPACFMHPRPGGPGDCGCKCRHQADCPQKDCPQQQGGAQPDCPKGQQPCPQHQPPAK